MRTVTTVKPGDRFRIKATPFYRKYGKQLIHGYRHKHEQVWPNEAGIGKVIERKWTAHDGTAMSDLQLLFPSGHVYNFTWPDGSFYEGDEDSFICVSRAAPKGEPLFK